MSAFLPLWAEYLIKALLICYGVIACGIAIGKTGRHPLWALLVLIPFVQIIAVWFLAYCHWPRLNPQEPQKQTQKNHP